MGCIATAIVVCNHTSFLFWVFTKTLHEPNEHCLRYSADVCSPMVLRVRGAYGLGPLCSPFQEGVLSIIGLLRQRDVIAQGRGGIFLDADLEY